jgi:hypothetical protein
MGWPGPAAGKFGQEQDVARDRGPYQRGTQGRQLQAIGVQDSLPLLVEVSPSHKRGEIAIVGVIC